MERYELEIISKKIKDYLKTLDFIKEYFVGYHQGHYEYYISDDYFIVEINTNENYIAEKLAPTINLDKEIRNFIPDTFGLMLEIN
jgi:hypothetical protein